MNTETLEIKMTSPTRQLLGRKGLLLLTIPTPTGFLELRPGEPDCIAAVISGYLEMEDLDRVVERVLVPNGTLIKTGNSIFVAVTAEGSFAPEAARSSNQKDSRRKVRTLLRTMERRFVDSVVVFSRSLTSRPRKDGQVSDKRG